MTACSPVEMGKAQAQIARQAKALNEINRIIGSDGDCVLITIKQIIAAARDEHGK